MPLEDFGHPASQMDGLKTVGAAAPLRVPRSANKRPSTVRATSAAASGRGGPQYGFGKESVTGPPGFEPGSGAPEASVISKLYYGPTRGEELRESAADRSPLRLLLIRRPNGGRAAVLAGRVEGPRLKVHPSDPAPPRPPSEYSLGAGGPTGTGRRGDDPLWAHRVRTGTPRPWRGASPPFTGAGRPGDPFGRAAPRERDWLKPRRPIAGGEPCPTTSVPFVEEDT